MDESKMRFILCAGCGKRIPIGDYINHTRTCQNREKPAPPLSNTFQRLLDSLPPVPIHNPECKCEICIGIKVCPNCKIRSMYLDKERRIWRCIKCHRYNIVRDPTQEPHSAYNDNPDIKRLEEWLRKNMRAYQ